MRSSSYLIQYLGVTPETPGIMLMSARTGLFYDWVAKSFESQPKNIVQRLELQTIPELPGLVQRFTHYIDTSKFDDGLYIAIYVNVNNIIMDNMLGEYIAVYQGGTDLFLPAKTIVSITTEIPK